jgi:hypothetical protein
MNIREISDIFKDTADNITAIKSYNFGWASDRVRQGNTEDFQELNEFPRVFFAVPTITGSDQTRKQDTYQVTLFFDDLLGYDNEGDEDPTLQIDKWANLQQYANYFVQRLNKIKQSILPNYLFIPEAPSITFDSFTGLQRMITVQLSFNLVVPTNCDPGIITLVQCIANIVTSSNLTASLTTVLKFAASLEGKATVTADINFVQKVASSLNANALLSGDINFIQKAQASLLTSASVNASALISKLPQASLLATGTTTADLTVNAPSAGLLLDLYPNAAAAYSLRKLRTAYSGSAIRVRASTSGAEGDVSFDVNSTISASSTVTVTAVGTSGLSIGQQVTFSTFWNAGGSNQNVFVTTWYDQSGNAKNATQATQASQPQIVNSGNILIKYNKPNLELISKHLNIGTQVILNDQVSIFGVFNSSVGVDPSGFINYQSMPVDDPELRIGNQNFINDYYNGGYALNNDAQFITGGLYSYTRLIGYVSRIYRNNNLLFTSSIRSGALSSGVNEFTIGRYNRINANRNGNISELIVYANDQSANIVNINTNINTHYAIY